jgi:hypothetical protein
MSAFLMLKYLFGARAQTGSFSRNVVCFSWAVPLGSDLGIFGVLFFDPRARIEGDID